jgi:hypothetical protein
MNRRATARRARAHRHGGPKKRSADPLSFAGLADRRVVSASSLATQLSRGHHEYDNTKWQTL